MLLNLDPDYVRSGPRLHSTCSKQFSNFIFNDTSNTLHM